MIFNAFHLNKKVAFGLFLICLLIIYDSMGATTISWQCLTGDIIILFFNLNFIWSEICFKITPDSQEGNIGSWNQTGHGNGWRGWWEHNGPLYYSLCLYVWLKFSIIKSLKIFCKTISNNFPLITMMPIAQILPPIGGKYITLIFLWWTSCNTTKKRLL